MPTLHYDLENEQRPVAWYRYILPKIMAEITRQPRYLPEIEWSEDLWTHNVFRAYEWLFFRKHGIRAEATVIVEDGIAYHYVHTLEAAVARVEGMVRAALNRQWVPPIRIYVPVLQTPQGFPMPASPFLFAIAFGNASTEVDTSTTSFSAASPSVSGSDRRAFLSVLAVRCNAIATPKWNGSNMTIAGSVRAAEAGSRMVGLWTILAPTTGSTTVATTATGNGNTPNHMIGIMSFYTGALQGALDATDGSTVAASGSINDSITTIADNCWVVACAGGAGIGGSGIAVSTGVTQRGTTGNADTGDSSLAYGDSNGVKSPAGAYSMTFTDANGGGNMAICMASFAPIASTDVTVNPSALSIVANIIAATVTAVRNVSTSLPTLSLTATQISPTVSAIQNATHSAPTLSVTINAITPDVYTPDAYVEANTLSISFSIQTPTVEGQRHVSTTVNTLEATFAVIAPSVSVAAVAEVSTLNVSLTPVLPVVEGIQNVSVSPSTLEITLNVIAPTVGVFVEVVPNTLSITATLIPPTITAARSVQVDLSPLTLTLGIIQRQRSGGDWLMVEKDSGDDWSVVARTP